MTTTDDVKARAAQKAQPPATTTSNPPAQPPATIGQLIQAMRGELARALPRHMDADRLARVALTALRKTPALAGCSQDSFAGALLTAAQLGLEPGVNGECYLIPYGKECTFVIGYQGFVKLFWQHPMAQNIDCHAVYRGDEFDFAYGLKPFLTHKPKIDGPRTRDDVIYYYAVASLTTGGSAFVVLTPEQVFALRKKEGPNGNIADPMLWMERKTAVRQLVKLLPKSANLVKALTVDEQDGSRLYAERLAERQLDQQMPQRQIEGEAVVPTDEHTTGVVTPPESEAPPGVDPETGEVAQEQPGTAAATGEPSFDEVRNAAAADANSWPETRKPPAEPEVQDPPYRDGEES